MELIEALTAYDERTCRLWLACAETLSEEARKKLRALYGSASWLHAHFSASVRQLCGDSAFDELAQMRDAGLDKLLARLDALDAGFVCADEADYPRLLAHISDAPDVLFFRGGIRAEETHALAVVGMRRETRYGAKHAHDIAMSLAQRGVCIVSGLARGIDTCAHTGALDGGGRTIAVLGCGIGRVYPPENEELAKRIIACGGALVSEYPFDSKPNAFHFPRRNRIISGLCEGVLLIEARERSGTMLTVQHAVSQGRDVLVLPGAVDAPGSAAPLRLLREGASPCRDAEDVIEDMRWRDIAQIPEQMTYLDNPAQELPDAPMQQQLLSLLQDEEKSFDELTVLSGLDVSALSTELTMLEMKGYIEQRAGRNYARVAAQSKKTGGS